ncbi:MAG: hypothetical protein AAF581_09135 [Planctomycetota bacterium]
MLVLRSVIAIACAVLASPTWGQQASIRLTGGAGDTGDSVVVTAMLDSNVNLGGWAWGVCSDSTLVQVQSSVDGSALLAFPPNFNVQELLPDGVAIAAVYFGAGLTFLPTSIDQEMYRVTYQIVGTGLSVPASLSFCGTLGTPPVSIECIVHQGGSFLPTTTDAVITINPAPTFRRGDVNSDGAFNLVDPIWLLTYLFVFGPLPHCADAADADDNGILQLTDVVFLLSALFTPSAPQPTGSMQCASDPTADSLDCLVSPCP